MIDIVIDIHFKTCFMSFTFLCFIAFYMPFNYLNKMNLVLELWCLMPLIHVQIRNRKKKFFFDENIDYLPILTQFPSQIVSGNPLKTGKKIIHF
jgi:hypothetical protein